MAVSPPNTVSLGQFYPQATWGDYNNINFAIQQALAKMQTAALVRVDACTNAGDLSPVGLVDVTPLVNQVDGAKNPTPHISIHNIPYFRIQGGANAIIIDPQPGDIGICVFASRDISKVKSTKKQANPGSHRQYSFSDGMYLGGVLNGVPVQFIQFNSSGITITSAANTVNGDTLLNGKLTTTGDTVAEGTSLHTHVHTNGNGGANTGEPV